MELWFKRDWSREKAKKLGYKFSVRRRTQFCLQVNQNCSLTNIWLLQSWHWIVTVRPRLRYFTISRVIELCFKRDWSRWKAKTRGYKFSVGRRTQFCLPNQLKFLINKHWIIIVQLLLSKNWTITLRPLLRVLTISRVIELCFKRDSSRWKAKIQGYKFSIGRRTQFCPQVSQYFSSTNIWLLLSWNCIVTVWPLLRFLTISRVINSVSSVIGLVGKLRHEDTSSL